LEQARKVFERFGSKEHQAWVWNELGSVYRQRLSEGDEWRAEDCFQKSLALARGYGDLFRIADNLEDLSILYFRLYQRSKEKGDEETKRLYWQKTQDYALEAREAVERHGDHYLLAKVIRGEADVLYEQGQYAEAFAKYLVACAEMAERLRGYKREWGLKARAEIRYEEMLDRLQEQLHAQPPEQIKEWAIKLMQEWQARELEQDFPEFMRMCQDSIDVARMILE